MAKNVEKTADLLGAKVVGPLPETGGAFGSARLARLAASLRTRLEPGEGGARVGRPTPGGCATPRSP